jgi:hypothetical protein
MWKMTLRTLILSAIYGASRIADLSQMERRATPQDSARTGR